MLLERGADREPGLVHQLAAADVHNRAADFGPDPMPGDGLETARFRHHTEPIARSRDDRLADRVL